MRQLGKVKIIESDLPKIQKMFDHYEGMILIDDNLRNELDEKLTQDSIGHEIPIEIRADNVGILYNAVCLLEDILKELEKR